jgi:hypothetical protein
MHFVFKQEKKLVRCQAPTAVTEEWYLLGCDAVQSDKSLPTFRRNVLRPSTGQKGKPTNQQASGKQSMASFPRNFSTSVPDYTA